MTRTASKEQTPRPFSLLHEVGARTLMLVVAFVFPRSECAARRQEIGSLACFDAVEQSIGE